MTWRDARLTAHFRLGAFFVSAEHPELLVGEPPPAVAANLGRLAHVLEALRMTVGQPIYVTSGWRTPELNAAIKGSANSHHLTGHAADLTLADSANLMGLFREIEKLDHRWQHQAFFGGRHNELPPGERLIAQAVLYGGDGNKLRFVHCAIVDQERPEKAVDKRWVWKPVAGERRLLTRGEILAGWRPTRSDRP